MTDAIRERVARAMRARLSVNILRHASQVSHEWLRELSEALASDVQPEVRAILLEEVAAIRREGHVSDTDAEQDRREMRAMAVFRVAERLAPVKQGEE